jgi:hypothetical protein
MDRSLEPFVHPIFSANIYASGLLDDALARGCFPFLLEQRRNHACSVAHMWVVRSGFGGDHLKIRVHAQTSDPQGLEVLFNRRIEGYLESLVTLPRTDFKSPTNDASVINVDEDSELRCPDRSLRWTTYRRSATSLPPGPWLADDTVVAHCCECLAYGCELAFQAIAKRKTLTSALRQSLIVRPLLIALHSLRLYDGRRNLEYLEYHRDWIMRFFVRDLIKAKSLIQQFDGQLSQTDAIVGQIRRLSEESLSTPKSVELNWNSALSKLANYLEKFPYAASYVVDPFAPDVTFLPILKVLHGLANQIGLSFAEEAYIYHLLIKSLS